MKSLDAKSAVIAAIAGGILLMIVVTVFDKLNDSTVFQSISPSGWLFMGMVVGVSVQTAERLTGAS